MKRQDILKKFLAGLFFILCMALIAGVVFIIGVEKGFTEPKFEMSVLFREVGGLAEGSPVRLSGVTVGTVHAIDFLPKEVSGRGVKVTLNLYLKYQSQLRKSSRIAIITEGVLGEKIVEITSDPSYRISDLSRPIIGEDPLDVENLAETFGESAEALLETSKGLDSVISEIREIAWSIRRLMGRIEQRIIDGNLFKVF